MEDKSALAELVLGQAADAVIFASRSGMIELCNPAATALSAKTSTNCLGRTSM